MLIDPCSYIPAKAQTIDDNFNLATVQSPPVSFNTSLLPTAVKLTSPSVSLSTTNFASVIKLSSDPVSFSTTNPASAVKLSSNPVSYLISQTADLIKLSSLPISYSLTSFTGEAIKLLSNSVAYRIYNGVPMLELISPNLLPISQDGRSIDISLHGDNFVQNSTASISTLKIQTKYVSQKELIATIPTNFLNKENSFEIFASNPPPEGGVSKGFNVMVVDPIPIARINATPSIGVAPQIVTFDGQDTEDLLAKYFGQTLIYNWNLGDESNDTANENSNTSKDPVVSHTYRKPGRYTATLNVVNAYGKGSTVTKEFEIREKNFAPDGTFIADLISGDVPLKITFTPSISDIENDEISYLWEFGDGQTSTEKNPSHLYIIAGKYQPKLTVSDPLNAKTIITSNKLTLLAPNNLPVAEIAAVPKESILKLNKEGVFTSEVQFISNGTYDPDNEELTYLWDFGDSETSSEINPKHEYKNSGNYNIKLTVTDPRNGQATKTISTLISKPQPNAVAQLDQTTGNAPFEVTFDGKSSQDYDGSPVTLKWDFGDGDFQIVDSTQEVIKHTYQDPGVYLTTLTALTADNRFTKINPGNIIVGANNGPVGQIIKLEGDEKGILGTAKVKLSAQGSFDPQNKDLLPKYNWSWSGRTWDVNGNLIDISEDINKELTSENTQETFEYTFTKAGQFTPVLEIEKGDGSKAKFYGETFTVTPDQAPVAVAKILSDKTVGDPGLEISFDGSESYDPKANGGLKILTWDFGDGEKSTGVSPKHIYNKEGTFTPTLIVVGNDNQIGFAQAASIKITNQAKDLNGNTIVRITSLQVSDLETDVKIQSAIDAMIKEAADTFISNDNKKPEIGPISIEPKTVSPGGVVKLSCFVKDDIALSNFGYTLIGPGSGSDGKVITQKVIDLTNKNQDNILTNEQYLEESIDIPEDLLPGTYKIKLTATDTSQNQIAKGNFTLAQNTNEEITVTFDITNQNTDPDKTIASIDKIILPSEVSTIIEKNLEARVYGSVEAEETSHTNIETLLNQGFFIRGISIGVGDKTSPQKSETIEAISEINKTRMIASTSLSNDNAKKTLKSQATGFQVTNATYVFNPWISISPSSTKTLYIDVITERDGYIEIGTKGSLPSNYFSKWYTTNVYVDSEKVGTIAWYFGIGISYTSNIANTVKRVEFRPVDSLGNELPSNTWTANYFTFTKIVQPTIASIFPTEGIAGRGAFDLRINGNNFTTTSKVYFDGYLLTPFAVSPTILYVRIPAYLVDYLGFKPISVLNSDGSQSSTQYYTTKANQNNPCNINKTLPQTFWGADAQTVLNGNNVYLSSPSATIEGNGSVTIPFCLDNNYDVRTTLNLSHYKNTSGGWNYIDFWIDGNYIGRGSSSTTQNLHYENLNTSTLTGSLHGLKISFNGTGTDQLIVNNATFSNGGIILNSINPTSVTLEGTGRVLNLYGNNFDQSLNVLVDNQPLTKLSVTGNQITASLPDKFSSTGPKSVQLIGNGKQSSILQLTVKNAVELLNGSFKVTPVQPFPGNSFDVELRAKDNQAGIYSATVSVFDPDGKLLTIPNVSNGYSTIVLNGIKDSNGEIFFKGSIPLSVSTKAGNHTVIAYVKRISDSDEDYSSLEAISYIAARALGLSYSDSLIPASHKLTFTPKPAVETVFGIEENNSENAGFIQVGNKVIQSDQSVKYKVQISSGAENASKLRYNFKSGDGRESGLIPDDNFTFSYQNTNTSSTTPITANPKLEIFWLEDGIQTKIGSYNGPTVFIYPNYSPVAKIKVSGNTYSTTPPLFTAFLDLDSYDPNQRFSSAVDYVDSKNNDWKLYQLKFNQDAQLVSLPVDSKISDDKKTFFSGNIYTPGSYFARLTVKDKTNLTDSASTESITLTKPSQMVIVFATTDPSDKKVFDPNNVILSDSEESHIGVPVKFKSTVTALSSNAQSTNYKWDFGDGSCTGTSPPDDCTQANPTHYYFNGKKSFNGNPYTDRKSVTPKLTTTTLFRNSTKETWEASAGTITFNAEPNFVLLDIKPDNTTGIVPFTVNLMIDSSTAKAVNATVSKYELDYGDDTTIESAIVTSFDELISKTFTHTYTTPGTYSPKLIVSINESTRTFVFNVPSITVAGTGVGGVYLLDDLSQLSFKNQPIVTFMILASFANSLDPNNSLRIRVKDEDGNETVTELDPNNSNQTISLSEGKNTYYFETSDSSNQVVMSEERSVVLDTEKPMLNIESPNENDLILPEGKFLISGTIEDKLFDSISYSINENSLFKALNEEEIDNLDNGKKAFSIKIDPGAMEDKINFIEILAKDKAGNKSLEKIEITSDLKARLLSKTDLKDIKEILNNSSIPIQLKQGEAFKLITKIPVCDDRNIKGTLGEANLILKDYSFSIDGQQSLTIPRTYPFILPLEITSELSGLNEQCREIKLFESGVLNTDKAAQFITPNGTPSFMWPLGRHTITQTLFADENSKTKYGTTFQDKAISTTTNFEINVIRDFSAEISGLTPSNLIFPYVNDLSLIIEAFDSIPFSSERKPTVSSIVITKPSGETVSISNPDDKCPLIQGQTYPNNYLKKKCSFSFTPDEYTNSSKAYTISTTIDFPPEDRSNSTNEGVLKDTAADSFLATKTTGIDFELPAQIISPTNYTVISSESKPIEAKITKSDLPPEEQDSNPSEIKKLIKYGIKLPYSKNKDIRSLFSYEQQELIVQSTMTASSETEINFKTPSLNFNLLTNSSFEEDFTSLKTFGPIYLYSAVSTASITSTAYLYGEPLKLILLDKPKIKDGSLKLNSKKGYQVLDLTITNNAPLNDKYALRLVVEPFDENDNPLGNTGQFNRVITIPKSTLSREISIPELPIETSEVKISLYRNEEFLRLIQKRILSEGWNEVNILDNYINNLASVKVIKTKGEIVTSCTLEPDTAEANIPVLFAYKLKSMSFDVMADGFKPDFENISFNISNVKQIIDPTNRIDSALQGNIPFTVPLDWKQYNNISFTVTSGSEFDTCKLNIGSQEVFKIGDGDDRTATYSGKTISVAQLKDLLVTLGYLLQTDAAIPGYTDKVNQAYWKFTCVISEAKTSTLDPNLRLQTADNPLMCGITYTEAPDIKYIEDVSSWAEIINGLKARVGNDISAYINPETIGTLAAIIAWNAILPINSWLLLVVGIIGAEVDITTRFNEVKDLWNNSSNINAPQTSGWKTGYTIGSLLTALPGILPANLANEVKIAEEAAKLENFSNVQDLIVSEQRTINSLSGLEPTGTRQNKLNNFITIVEKTNEGGKKVLNDVVQRLKDRNYDKFLPINKFGLATDENIALLTKVINRDGLAIPLTDQELNDLLFTIVRNVSDERLNLVVTRISNNLIDGRVSSSVIVGNRILREDAALQVLNGERTLGNLSGKTFCSEIQDILSLSDLELIRTLGLDTISDLDRFIGQKVYSFEIPTNNLKVELPNSSISNENFVNGGITSGGEFEFWIDNGWPSNLLTRTELENLGVKILERQSIKLSEFDIRELLSKSLNPPSNDAIESFIINLKGVGKI